MNILKNFIKDEQGQDLIEYTLLIAFVALGAAAVMGSLSANIANIFNATGSALSSSIKPASS